MFHVGTALGAAASVSLLLVACGGEPRASDELARAKLTVQQADAANAHRYAAAELNEARDKLSAAERADSKNQNDDARKRANEATANAELAMALARSREAERAVSEQQKDLDALRQEANQGIPETNSKD
jgi:hypothetical protein